jgi:hypothetical protein
MKRPKPRGTPANRGKCGPGGCAVCRHPKRHAIDLRLTYGDSARSVAEMFEVHYDAVLRHKNSHLSAAMQAAILTASKPSPADVEALTKSESEGLLAALVTMRARLAQHARACADVGDHKGAIRAEQVTLANLETVARLVGQLISRSEVVSKSYLITPDYLRVRQILIEELRPHPEIASRVARRIAALENEAAAEIIAQQQPKPPFLIEASP